MQRYFTKEKNWDEKYVYIVGDDAHHINRVMRMKIGERIICNHPDERAAICEIIDISKEAVKVEIIEWIDEDAELPVSITIAQGLPKGNKLEIILQKGTELGANNFILFEGDRSIAKWDKKKSDQKLNRYRKIVKEASEQCHRNKIPEIDVIPLQTILENGSDYDIMMYAYEEEAKKINFHPSLRLYLPLNQVKRRLYLSDLKVDFQNVEVDLFHKYDCQAIRLGARILRTETASLYALASVSYHFEELRCHECQQSHSIH